ncbi:MAG: Mtc1 family protein [Oligoflexia bacterium]|nr:Mtc1 family protein [Oligoflexia bacterium]
MSEKNDDKGFNDAELQDIMDEIESLEQEFVEDSEHASENTTASEPESSAETEVEAKAETPEPTPESEPTAEVVETKAEDKSEDVDDVLGQIENEIENEVTDNVVEMKQPEPATPETSTEVETPAAAEPTPAPVATTTDSSVSFTGNGHVDFQMSVNLGGKTATLKVDPGKGLVVNLEGVDLQITEDGCSVEMDGGVKFSVPFGNTEAVTSSDKKKTAA